MIPLPSDGQVKIRPAYAGIANHAVGERRSFKISQGEESITFTGRLAYDDDFNLTVIDIDGQSCCGMGSCNGR